VGRPGRSQVGGAERAAADQEFAIWSGLQDRIVDIRWLLLIG